jgi:hypothetical protein
MAEYLIPVRETRIIIIAIEADDEAEALRAYESGEHFETVAAERSLTVERMREPACVTNRSIRDEAQAMVDLLEASED